MTVPCPILSRHSPSSTVALACPTTLGLSEPKTKQDLLLDAARLAARLPALAPDQHILAVFRQDRYAFVVALLAAWSRGYTVCLPPNQRGATIADLLTHGTPGAGIGALVHDTGAAGYISVPHILSECDDVSPLSSVDPPDPAVRVMTSGSTGQSVAWNKSASQLLSEVLVLAETFGLTPGTTFAVTVPPSHVIAG
jgi:acyl-CoA synthetase (AMP-forming)/AMP-acid ligase II